MKFDQLIEYNKKKSFIENSCRRRGREASCETIFVF